MKRSNVRRNRLLCASALVSCIFSVRGADAQTWTNLVTNSGFENRSTSPWVIKSNSPSATVSSATVSANQYTTLDLVLYDSGTEVTDLEVGQAGLGLVSGRKYRVTFWGMADPSVGYAGARVKVGAVAPPYTSYFESDV